MGHGGRLKASTEIRNQAKLDPLIRQICQVRVVLAVRARTRHETRVHGQKERERGVGFKPLGQRERKR